MYNIKYKVLMQKTLFISLLLLTGLLIYAQFEGSYQVDAHKIASGEFKFSKTTHDFGKIAQGKPVSAEFEFENTGDAPLMITKAKASCGCTVPSYPKEPIPPGGTGTIKAVYNAANVGVFNKSITLTANVPTGTVKLYIKGEVIK